MRVGVAASGGRDSTALLHCTWRVGAALGIEVVALHVHHGLVPQADDWLVHLRRQVARWSARGPRLGMEVERLSRCPAKGDSIEAWARRERYAALLRLARQARCDIVLLAHHRRDQAETVLLQALRGAGAAGLSAMRRAFVVDGVVMHRPWLESPREAIEAYVRRHRLSHVDDASNANPRFARNRLRLAVWPALQASFPDAEPALARVADRAQTARAAINALAAIDAVSVEHEGTLGLRPWLALEPARREIALRHWLARTIDDPAADSLVARLMTELPAVTSGRWPCGRHQLRLFRGRLSVTAEPNRTGQRSTREEPIKLDLSQPGIYPVPGWGGQIEVLAAEEGVPSRWLSEATLRGRHGGEQFRAQPRAADRSLKKQFQAAGIPAWTREGPLVFSGERLIFVPFLGIDARVRRRGEPGLITLNWQTHPHR